MYSTGMRISEVAGLRLADIDFGKGIVYVNCGKGGESRIAWLNDYAGAVLRLYVDEDAEGDGERMERAERRASVRRQVGVVRAYR